ncbi:TolC family protein [Zobellia barbeyronii]|uniref:TolC family protein n=1 Tax=Zobellia barbeyronii TaxID=2748009 RepID=A0ABS5WA26_9FLAO|nr:TolC family protein [Zobellia barbeyronii]
MKNKILMSGLLTIFLVSSTFCQTAEKAQTLLEYIQEAEANNPEIQAFEVRYSIAEEKKNEANSLPNTEFSAGYFVVPTETRTGTQIGKFSAKQMMPWFGTITARENYASSLAEAEFVSIVIAKRKLALSVSQSYYQLYEIRAQQAVLEENIQLLNTYEQLALTSIEVGNASAVDVLRLQIRQNEIQQDKEVLEEAFLSERTAFNKLLNRNEDSPIAVVQSLELIEDEAAFIKENMQLHPEILKYDKLYESVEQSELLNQSEGKPSIGFGFDYIALSERTDIEISKNGKDIFMPMLSVSVPIFNKRYKSISKQNDLRQQELQLQKDERLNVLQTAFAKAKGLRNQARIKYTTQVKNLKQAKDAEEILISSYETGTIDFNDVLDIQELQLKFAMNQIDAVQVYYSQSAVVNYLMN